MHSHALFNEDIRRLDDPILSAAYLGPFTGWGVFTTLRIARGVPFAWERHFARMMKDAQILRMPFPYNPDALRKLLLKLAAENGVVEGAMRVYVGRTAGNAWSQPLTTGGEVYLVATTKDDTTWADTVTLSLHPEGRHAASRFRGTKTLTWAHNTTMLEEARAAGYDETILLNERGQVAECTAANLFAVKDGITWTPPLADGPLPGVTRAILLEEISSPALPVQERTLYPQDLFDADEVFITSTTRDLLPVARVATRDLAASSRPVMERLRELFREHVEDYIELAAGGVPVAANH